MASRTRLASAAASVGSFIAVCMMANSSPPMRATASISQALAQQHAVGQVGQSVVQRHVLDLLLDPAPLADILMRGDPSPALHRLVDDEDLTPAADFGYEACGLALPDSAEHVAAILSRIGRKRSGPVAMLDQLQQIDSRLGDVRRQ